MDVRDISGILESPEYITALEVAHAVRLNICGRVADYPEKLALMGILSALCGGNYLEIGTLFGGSMITISLIRELFGVCGTVVCIDPLNGYYYDRTGMGEDLCGVAPTKEVLLSNATLFDVQDEVVVYEQNSIPFPQELESATFGMSYIDGDHWGDVPERDWMNVKDITTDLVVIDNCSEDYPDVKRAVDVALSDDEWYELYGGAYTILHRSKYS